MFISFPLQLLQSLLSIFLLEISISIKKDLIIIQKLWFLKTYYKAFRMYVSLKTWLQLYYYYRCYICHIYNKRNAIYSSAERMLSNYHVLW